MLRSVLRSLSVTLVSVAGVLYSLPAVAADAPSPSSPAKSDWDVTIGGGLVVGPKYEGGRKMQVAPIPLINITWRNRVFLDGPRLGVYAINTDSFKLSASVGYGGGREEKDGPRLEGMGKIRSSFQPQIAAAYTLGPVTFSSAITRDIGGAKGLTATFGAEVGTSLTEKLGVTAGISGTWADSNYMKSYFGVTAEQAARSGNSAFSASSGFKNVDLTVGAHYAVTEHWMALTSVGVQTLVGDARKSPVTERKTAFVSMFGVAYKF